MHEGRREGKQGGGGGISPEIKYRYVTPTPIIFKHKHIPINSTYITPNHAYRTKVASVFQLPAAVAKHVCEKGVYAFIGKYHGLTLRRIVKPAATDVN